MLSGVQGVMAPGQSVRVAGSTWVSPPIQLKYVVGRVNAKPRLDAPVGDETAASRSACRAKANE